MISIVLRTLLLRSAVLMTMRMMMMRVRILAMMVITLLERKAMKRIMLMLTGGMVSLQEVLPFKDVI